MSVRKGVPRDPIALVTACDDAYAQHTTVFLRSLFETNPDSAFRVFLLTPTGFAHENAILRNVGPHCGTIEVLRVEPARTAPLKLSHHLSAATYLRLFLDELLPRDLGRAIYMDSDVIVRAPIDALWRTALDDRVLAAVVDAIVDGDAVVRERIGLAASERYFNAGVLLIDLHRWREERLGERAVEVVRTHPERITWHDQCALNHLLRGRFHALPETWNFQTHHLAWIETSWSESGWPERVCTSESLHALESARIVHFTTEKKPWLDRTEHPAKPTYWRHLRETEWRDHRPVDRTVGLRAEQALARSARALVRGLRKLGS